MKDFFNIFLSWVKLFLYSSLVQVVFFLVKFKSLTTMDWDSVISAGLIAVLPVIINYLNPNFTGYGNKTINPDTKPNPPHK
jgi:hypothetical protein